MRYINRKASEMREVNGVKEVSEFGEVIEVNEVSEARDTYKKMFPISYIFHFSLLFGGVK